MEQDKIVIEHLNLWYGSFQALKDINLRLPANEITAFIGPSGCGKSTLLKSLNRMNDLVEGCRIEGTVTLDGEDIFSRKMDVNLLRKRVCLAASGNSLEILGRVTFFRSTPVFLCCLYFSTSTCESQ